ncbi:InlB B-repeat-containing protein [Agathobacter sp.]|uniref:InlB B-repeat-containing protein n=1 Tax=Agathobacter sp. TaxID=2021311 RepID=UPI002A91F812|nr:InlB B-repeat-containing protein [Agathobacter sp.]MDY5862362.1 InlB B-repeat-containing protein [Agathobacter sp.]
MAIEKSFQLYINKDNVKDYFTASGGVLNGAQISTKYITMRTSSTTATFTMNDAGRDVLFPSAAAIAHKVDVWAQAIATLNNSKNTINVAIAGQNAITTERIHTSLTEYTGSVSGSFTKSNTSAVYVIKILNVFHAAGVRDTSITAYFTQYSCTANKSGNGVKNVSVSNAEPYAGETVTFFAELYNGANFDGWYSDKSCTQLVSSSLTYSTTAAADLTLYAKAIIDADIYNCSAVAGENIASASVSDDSVVSGDSVTFTAQLNEHCTFDGWFSDSNYTILVSTANPYTAAITSDTTLYAKGTKIPYSINVGIAEHGTATVSINTAHYGDSVTFTFTPEDETWELYGWYSDEELTQLVSESNPYTHSVIGNVMLYPKVGRIRYKITFKTGAIANTIDMKVAVLDFDALTRAERSYLKVGNYEAIKQSKVFDIKSASISSLIGKILTVEILCPLGMTAAFWGRDTVVADRDYTCYIKDANNKDLTSWPYYWCQPSEDATFRLFEREGSCYCSAIAKEGINYADATTPTCQGHNAIFEAEVASGYTFSGWYSDEGCTTFISSDNPLYITAPSNSQDGKPVRSELTLYAQARSIAGKSDVLYFKVNGIYKSAAKVYKKISGAWVEQEDLSAIFSGESSGTASNYVYGGSV